MRKFLLTGFFVGILQVFSTCATSEESSTKKEGGDDKDKNSTLIILPQLTVPVVRHGAIFSYYILGLTAEAGDPEKSIQVRQKVPFLMNSLFSDLYKMLTLNYQNQISEERIQIYINAICDKVFGKSFSQVKIRTLYYHGIKKKI